MKHKFLRKEKLDTTHALIEVELMPDDDDEKIAIEKVESMEATEEQRTSIDDYLLFNLRIPYSVLSVERQEKTRFILKVSPKLSIELSVMRFSINSSFSLPSIHFCLQFPIIFILSIMSFKQKMWSKLF